MMEQRRSEELVGSSELGEDSNGIARLQSTGAVQSAELKAVPQPQSHPSETPLASSAGQETSSSAAMPSGVQQDKGAETRSVDAAASKGLQALPNGFSHGTHQPFGHERNHSAQPQAGQTSGAPVGGIANGIEDDALRQSQRGDPGCEPGPGSQQLEAKPMDSSQPRNNQSLPPDR